MYCKGEAVNKHVLEWESRRIKMAIECYLVHDEKERMATGSAVGRQERMRDEK